jgi:hypothetical protein
MKRTKLVAVRITPILVILNENDQVIAEETAPTTTIYPGNPFTMDELRAALEHSLPDHSDKVPDGTTTH